MPATLNPQDFWSLAPESLLTLWGLVLLTLDFSALRGLSSDRRRSVLSGLTLAGVALALGVAVWTMPSLADEAGSPLVFSGTLTHDAVAGWFDLVVILLLGLVVVMTLSSRFTDHWGEYYALLCWAAVGMMVLIAAWDLLVLFVALEMMTICLYLLTSFEKVKRRSAEGGLKYFVYGSVSSALFLFGLSLIYGMTGSTRLDAIRSALLAADPAGGLDGNLAGALAVLLILVGFGFKVAAVPFHQWAPDAYEGAPTPITAWIATGSKVSSFIAVLRVLVSALAPWAHREGSLVGPGWIGLIALLAAASMTYGNFAALTQRNLKRLLAYSSIAHAGYLLVGILAASVSVEQDQGAAGAVLFYLVVYAAAKIGAFALAAWLSRDLDHEDLDGLNGLGYRAPGLAFCIVLLMLSLVGMPPLAGFFGKLSMFMQALNTAETGRLTLMWLVALGLINSVVSAFYYVRILKAMFLRVSSASEATVGSPSLSIAVPIVLSTVVVAVLSVRPGLLLDPMTRIARSESAPAEAARPADSAVRPSDSAPPAWSLNPPPKGMAPDRTARPTG
jgi:NADH-quinone oxidoreductase subunit N